MLLLERITDTLGVGGWVAIKETVKAGESRLLQKKQICLWGWGGGVYIVARKIGRRRREGTVGLLQGRITAVGGGNTFKVL